MTADPIPSSRLLDQEQRYGAPADPPLAVCCTRADGVYVWDLEGKRYLDFTAAHSAVNQGHNHTRIAAAMVEQCLRLSLIARDCHHDRLPPLLEKLCTLTGFEKALLMSTGAEAVEAAIQAARRWGEQRRKLPAGQAELIVFTGSGHGRTLGLAGGSEDPLLQAGFEPSGLQRVPFGDLAATQAAVGPLTCAILVEPIQASGIIVPPKGFLKGLRELCDRQGLLLLADERQCGLGRTGRLLAGQHEGIKADGLVLGRALSGGFYPVSAFLASRELMSVVTPGAHGATFGGSPLACAVAVAALDVLAEEHLVDHAAELGAYFLERLRQLDSPHLREVRGLGLWAGLELKPEAGGARRFCQALLQQGLLCASTQDRTLCLSPPLSIAREQLDWAVDQLKVVLEA